MSRERMLDPESRIRLLRSAPMEEARLKPASKRSSDPDAPIGYEDPAQLLLRRASHEAAAALRRRFAEKRHYLNPGLSDRTIRNEFIDPLLAEISELLLGLGSTSGSPRRGRP